MSFPSSPQSSGGPRGFCSTTGPVLVVAATVLLSACSGSAGQVAKGAAGTVDRSGSSGPTASSGQSPTVSLTAASSLINAGGQTTLNWSSTNATSCAASGGWNGNRATSGSATVGPLDRQTTFSLSGSGGGGSTLAMVSVSVRGAMSVNWVAPTENANGTPLTDLAGYRIYYGDSSRAYAEMREVASPSATSATLTLPSGDYYVAMTALDGQGNESTYSNEVLKTVL